VTGIYHSEDLYEQLAKFPLLARLLDIEVQKLLKSAQLVDTDLLAKWFIIRRIWMQFFRFYKNAPISEEVVIEMVQNVRNPVREVIVEMIIEDLKSIYIPEPELAQFEYMAQIKHALDEININCDVSLSED